MWSYDYTSTASKLADQCRVGVKLGAATSTTEVVALFNTVAKEKANVQQSRPKNFCCLRDLRRFPQKANTLKIKLGRLLASISAYVGRTGPCTHLIHIARKLRYDKRRRHLLRIFSLPCNAMAGFSSCFETGQCRDRANFLTVSTFL